MLNFIIAWIETRGRPYDWHFYEAMKPVRLFSGGEETGWVRRRLLADKSWQYDRLSEEELSNVTWFHAIR